jgi:hypothetical protein
MIATRSIGRLAAAAVLVAAATVVSFGSPVGAVGSTTTTTLAPDVNPTGSLVDNGDGTVTLTYANIDSSNNKDVFVIFAAANSTCSDAVYDMVNATTLIISSSNFGVAVTATASPMLIKAGTAVVSFPGYPTSPTPVVSTLPAGEYQTCLYANTDDPESETGYVLLSSAPLAISAAPAPAPAPEPVVPAYTG